MIEYYILDEDKNVVPTLDVLVWSKFLEERVNKIVQHDHIPLGEKELFLSTVFLGLDHAFGEGDPVLFETMLFFDGDFSELYMERYTNYDDALNRHNQLLEGLINVNEQIKEEGISAEDWAEKVSGKEILKIKDT